MLRLQHERRLRGWSQADLGRLAAVPQTTVSAIERGERLPSPEQLDRLARTLGVESGFDLLLPVVTPSEVSA